MNTVTGVKFSGGWWWFRATRLEPGAKPAIDKMSLPSPMTKRIAVFAMV
jgi:hypothetical protein